MSARRPSFRLHLEEGLSLVRFITSLRRAALGLSLLTAAASLAGAAQAQDVTQGRAIFTSTCAVCHNAARGAPAKIGPNLFGVVGRRPGTVAGFNYSPAMRNARFTWTTAQIATYLQHPAQTLPGNRMPFAGLPAPRAAAVAAYLATLH